MASEEALQEEKCNETKNVSLADKSEQSPKMSAFIVGYTGEVGKELVKELAKRNTFEKLLLIGRRKVEYKDETIANNSSIEQVLVNFDELEKSKHAFEGVQVGFCCLGTTKGKSGKKGQWKVEHDYVVKSAELAKEGGCKQFHLVTAMGANSTSMMYVLKLKAITEDDVKAVGIERTSIYRPAGLMCNREENRRILEKIAMKALVPMDYFFPGVMTNATHIVAKAMINNVSKTIDSPSEIFEPKEIHKLGTET